MMKRLVILRQCQPTPPPSPPSPPSAGIFSGCCGGVWYGECRRNHVASMGAYAVDGCLEFMADGEEGTSGALHCAACGCHRSFHRRVVVQHCFCGGPVGVSAESAGSWDCSSSSESTASSSTPS